VICTPSLSIHNANVTLDLQTGNIMTVTRNGSFVSGQSPYSNASYNVTGIPLNGSAYNGIGFNLRTPTEVDLAREAAIQLQLPAAVFEFAGENLTNESVIYNSDAVVPITAQVYVSPCTPDGWSMCSHYILPADDIPGASCSNSVFRTDFAGLGHACDDRHQAFICQVSMKFYPSA
jgi:hypothetical protein